MDALVRDLRYAVRTLVRMRGAGVIAILTLALGIGATTTMFSVVYASLLRPAPFDESDRLVVLFSTRTTPRDGRVTLRWSMPNAIAVRRTTTAFESSASFTSVMLSMSGLGDPEHIEGEVVSAGYFRTLRVPLLAGRPFTEDESTATGAQLVAAISYRLWQRKFAGAADVLGHPIVINTVPLTIVAILPEGFAGLSGRAELWMPPPMAARLTYAEYLTSPQHFVSIVARLATGVTLQQANAELAALGPRFADRESAADATWSAEAVPLRRARIDPGVQRSALVLLAGAVCVLLIACVNVASLLLARARVRRREIAVRLAIGSGRARLVRQLLTEGLVLALVAGACGTMLASWGVRVFARSMPAVIPSGRNNYAVIGTLGAPALDPLVLMFALAVALGTSMVFGLAPALAASRAELVTALKETERGGGRARALSGLVVAEVAIACVLLAASALLIAEFARLQGRRAGFVSERVLTFWVRPPVSRYPVESGPAIVERLLTRIQSVPGVDSAAVNRCTPFTGCSRTVLFLPGRPIDPQHAPVVGRHYVSPDFFRTLGIPLLAGRTLTNDDRPGRPPVAVVSESGARRFWPGENPIGKRVWFGTTTGPFSDPARAVEIVGVAGDVKYEGVDQPVTADRAEFYTSYLQFSYPDTMVIVKARADAAALVTAMRRAVASVDPALPIYDVLTLDDRIDAAVARPRFNATLLAAFAAAALLLAAIGVYGMLSYAVSARMREIGVRLALGADAARVMRLVLGEGCRLAVLGAIVGFVASFAIARVVRRFTADVPPWDIRVVAAAGVILLGVAALAAFAPARRAGAVDPAVVLRQE